MRCQNRILSRRHTSRSSHPTTFYLLLLINPLQIQCSGELIKRTVSINELSFNYLLKRSLNHKGDAKDSMKFDNYT